MLQDQPLHPLKHTNLYKHIKRRVGHSLRGTHCKGNLVPSRKQVAHKLSGSKSGLPGPKRVSGPPIEQHSSHSYRQHLSGYLYKQGGDDIGPTVCPCVENPTHSRPAESKPNATWLAPRATVIKEQGFSEAVTARIEAPKRGSTRSVHEGKWTIFNKVVPQ